MAAVELLVRLEVIPVGSGGQIDLTGDASLLHYGRRRRGHFQVLPFNGAADSPTAWTARNGYAQYENTYVVTESA